MTSKAVPFTQDLVDYLDQIRRETHCSRKRKEKMLDQLEIDIQDYLSCHEVKDFTQVVAHFGDPADIADSFVQLGDVTKVRKELKASKRWVHVVWICLIAVAVMIHLFVGWFFNREAAKNDSFRNGKFVVTVREGELVSHESSEVQIY